ncbi:MAG: cytochrome c3 family protein [Deferrisomatales bacterium]
MGRVTAWIVAALAVAGVAGAGLMESVVSRVTVSSGVAQGPSRRCGGCHSPEFALWIRHPHSRFLIDPERDPRQVAARWGEGVPGWSEHVGGRFGAADVALAYGVLDVQVYFRRDGGRHRLLGAQWDLREGRWTGLPPELERIRAAGTTWEDGCAGCHTTGYHAEDGTFAEANAGCGACHGDGSGHVAAGGRSPILRPSSLTADRRSMVCGACHSRGRSRASGRPYPEGFVPGGILGDHFLLESPEPGRATEHFWADGTERLPFMEYQGFVQSGHARVGLTCTTCHLPHGSDHGRGLRRRTDDLCRGCHPDADKGNAVHRGHPQAKAACVDCHMAPGDPRPGRFRMRTHTFRVRTPSPTLTGAGPSSCTVECHPGRDSAWAWEAAGRWRAR